MTNFYTWNSRPVRGFREINSVSSVVVAPLSSSRLFIVGFLYSDTEGSLPVDATKKISLQLYNSHVCATPKETKGEGLGEVVDRTEPCVG